MFWFFVKLTEKTLFAFKQLSNRWKISIRAVPSTY